MAIKVGLTCDVAHLPPSVQRILGGLPDSGGRFAPMADVAEVSWPPEIVGAAILVQLVQEGHLTAPSEGFAFRAALFCTTLAKLVNPAAAVTARAAAKKQLKLTAHLFGLCSLLLEEADQFWPPEPAGPARRQV